MQSFEWKITKPVLINGRIEKEVVGTFEQIPLKLAWAITIHKSQGQTFDRAIIYPDCWDFGQLYTALSRLTGIHGLYLAHHINDNFLVTSKEVLDFLNGKRKTDDGRRAKTVQTRHATRRVSNKKDITPDKNIDGNMDDFDIRWGTVPDDVELEDIGDDMDLLLQSAELIVTSQGARPVRCWCSLRTCRRCLPSSRVRRRCLFRSLQAILGRPWIHGKLRILGTWKKRPSQVSLRKDSNLSMRRLKRKRPRKVVCLRGLSGCSARGSAPM